MSLSCSCEFYPSDYDSWYWEDHSSFKPLATKKRRRCCSCKEQINIGSDTIEFFRYRNTKNDIEERIHGERVSLASSFMCEECAGLYLALDELGYGCLDISQPMKDYVDEYNEMREEAKDSYDV